MRTRRCGATRHGLEQESQIRREKRRVKYIIEVNERIAEGTNFQTRSRTGRDVKHAENTPGNPEHGIDARGTLNLASFLPQSSQKKSKKSTDTAKER